VTILAACRRASILALAVVCEGTVLDICRFRLQGPTCFERIADLVRKIAADYSASAIVAEPDSVVSDALSAAGIPFLPTTVAEAREQLMAPTVGRLRHELYAFLIDDHPQLRPYLRLQAESRRLATSDRSRIAPLLAVALGLGAARRDIAAQLAGNCLLN
jgi:hypothetical protein